MHDLVNQYNLALSGASPEKILSFVMERHGPRTAFSTSLGAEDQVIFHMMAQAGFKGKVFTLDTGRLFPETYELLDITIKKYGLSIDLMFPDTNEVQKMVREKGINLFYESVENRKLCCYIRKVEPMRRALEGKEIWITGLRRDQSETRTDLSLVEWDDTQQIIKVNPLLEWTEQQVWDYIHENRIPYNTLHDKGFPSIGCQPCTRAILPGEDIRAGRWWWESPSSRECGLHTQEESS